ncbi:MAG: ferrous iron transport protein A [Verrucomicrobiae bacterium]|nr:ferrous iron transport protein A [Verrucomicrobiae bacterium]
MSEALQPLSSLPVGTDGRVMEIGIEAGDRARLMEMGVLVGTRISVVRFAPLGDPVEIKVRGYHLSLRRHEADRILVRPAGGGT